MHPHGGVAFASNAGLTSTTADAKTKDQASASV